jgi:MbtH protein
MNAADHDKTTEPVEHFQVVVNGEEQYSIWPLDLEVPAGWHATGKVGEKAACLEFIRRMWTDMRPLSTRRPAGSPWRR